MKFTSGRMLKSSDAEREVLFNKMIGHLTEAHKEGLNHMFIVFRPEGAVIGGPVTILDMKYALDAVHIVTQKLIRNMEAGTSGEDPS